MTEIKSSAEGEICCGEDGTDGDMLKHCPMAARFDQVFGNSNLGFYLMLFGIVLVLLGIAIVVQPKILVWLASAVAIVIGTALLFAAHQINHMKSSLQD